MRAAGASDRCRVFCGDCNDRIKAITDAIPSGSLTLAFIDPEGLHVDLQTLRQLSSCGRVDLLILLADRMDIVRNVDSYVHKPDSNLDRMLGSESRWRDQWSKLLNRTPPNICKLFAEVYQRQLQLLGYIVFGEKVIESSHGPLYRLIFASKHARGLEFWDKVTKRDVFGESGLFE